MSENKIKKISEGADRFQRWESVIRSHETDFWKVGEALINIKVNELWREEYSGKPYKSWEDYIEKAWGYISRAKRLMQAAKLHEKLSEAGMSDETFRRIVKHEAQADKLSKVASLSKNEMEKFVEAVEEKAEDADFESASEAFKEIKPPKFKSSPEKLTPEERKKLLIKALDKAGKNFDSKIEAIFDEFADPETVDSWLKNFAESILERLSK